jgi:hypothetical protein
MTEGKRGEKLKTEKLKAERVGRGGLQKHKVARWLARLAADRAGGVSPRAYQFRAGRPILSV